MHDEITIVSGLPRSGTSMMMKMLEAGGLEAVTDGERTADEDNPKGYYEFESVKTVREDVSWLPQIQGKVVKMVSELLFHLPEDFEYRIVFMERNLDEVIRSQNTMLERMGRDRSGGSDDQIRKLFEKHLKKVKTWLSRQANIRTLFISYNDTLENPKTSIEELKRFFSDSTDLDTDKMSSVIDPNLYRQKKG